MNLGLMLLPGIGAMLLAWVLSRHFANPASMLYVLDHPNERSLHKSPIPRGGGAAIVIAIVIAGLAMAMMYPVGMELRWIAGCASIVAIVSFIDDRLDVHPFYRLLIHAFAALALASTGLALQQFSIPAGPVVVPALFAVPVSALYLVWMTNLYNFMDGMDGFAAGMAVSGFAGFAVLGWMAGDAVFAASSLVVVGAAAGFLVLNFPPARIFMGDTGSAFLGFLAGAFSLWGSQRSVFPFWTALLIFSPFIVDATVTLLRRVWEGQKVWEAHRTHYYQRLVQTGWSHRRTVMLGYLVMLACAASATFVARASSVLQWTLLSVWVCVYVAFALAVNRREARVARSLH